MQIDTFHEITSKFCTFFSKVWLNRECICTGAAGAQTHRSFWTSPFSPADFEAFSTIQTRRF